MTFKTHYEPVPVTEKPDKDGFYFTLHGERTGNNWFRNGKWLDEIMSGKPTEVTHWLRPRPDTVLLTREEVREMILKAFDAGMNRQHGNDFGKVPNPYPDLDTYINNQFK